MHDSYSAYQNEQYVILNVPHKLTTRLIRGKGEKQVVRAGG